MQKECNTAAAIDAYRRAIYQFQSVRQDILFAYSRGRFSSFKETLAPIYLGLVDLLLQQAATETDAEREQELLREARDTLERHGAISGGCKRELYGDVTQPPLHPARTQQPTQPRQRWHRNTRQQEGQLNRIDQRQHGVQYQDRQSTNENHRRRGRTPNLPHRTRPKRHRADKRQHTLRHEMEQGLKTELQVVQPSQHQPNNHTDSPYAPNHQHPFRAQRQCIAPLCLTKSLSSPYTA
jgi:hypothetical protein